MNTIQQINAVELFNLIPQPKVLVVDVRNSNEVALGKLPNALHIELPMLPVQHAKLEQAQHVVFYCHNGIRSALAADFSLSKGINNVYNLDGGIDAWANAGYSIVKK